MRRIFTVFGDERELTLFNQLEQLQVEIKAKREADRRLKKAQPIINQQKPFTDTLPENRHYFSKVVELCENGKYWKAITLVVILSLYLPLHKIIVEFYNV